ncbi:MAG TPA: response regulator [Ignavibacteria bacterium]|nr:response regulator [Ignavibacteria bacterium]
MRILIVEDNYRTRKLLLCILQERFDNDVIFEGVSDLKNALNCLKTWRNIDRKNRLLRIKILKTIVILDLSLPDSSGRNTFIKLFKSYPDIPIVVMTNTNNRTLAEEMIDLGAQDYILKSFTNKEEIFRRISFAIKRHSRTVSILPEDADSIHTLESNNSSMLNAHESGEHEILDGNSIKVLSSITELIKKTFVGVQEVNIKQEKLAVYQEYSANEVKSLKDEVLGIGGRRSMRSDLEVLSMQFKEINSDFTDLKKRINIVETNNRIDVRSNNIETVQLRARRIDNKTKIIIAILSFLGILITSYIIIRYNIKTP